MSETSETKKKNGWGAIALGVLFWLPLLSGVVSRLTKGRDWFGDYGAVACGAEKWLQGAAIYDQELACPGVHGVVYVYHPWVAQAFAAPLAAFGQQTMLWIYAALFAFACLALIWIMVGRSEGGPKAERSRFAAFLTGSAIYWGNIAVPLFALVGVIGVGLKKRPSLLVLAIALAAIVKPLFLTFCAVFALREWPAWRRAVYALVTVALGAAPTLYFLQTGGALAAEWRALLEYFVYVDRPGDAFFGWLTAIGQPIATPGASIMYLTFAGVMTLAGVVLAEALELDADARVLLGLSLGVLLLPRLMPQDFWLLGPGFVALAATWTNAVWLRRVVLGVCVLALIGNLGDLADYTTRIATLVLALTLLIAAGFALTRTSPAIVWRRVWTGKP